jgi:hypothetical protein
MGWRDKWFWVKEGEEAECPERRAQGLPTLSNAGCIAVLIFFIAIGLGVWVWYASL